MGEVLDIRAASELHKFLLIDTCVLIYEVRRQVSVLKDIPFDQRRTSVFALWEFLHGKEGATLGRVERAERREWLRDNGIIDVNLHNSACTSFRSLLELEGSPPGAVDCVLAAECLARGWPIVTSNTKHFASVTGLKVVEVPAP